MRSITIGFFVGLVVTSTAASAVQAQDSGSEPMVVQGWRYCTTEDKHSCLNPGGEKTVQAYSRDGDPLGQVDLSALHFPLAGDFNPEYSLVKLTDSGCKGGPDGSCWVMKRYLQVQYCRFGARQVAGAGTAATQSATSMGSGGGCKQQ